jgi:hypothetical protein
MNENKRSIIRLLNMLGFYLQFRNDKQAEVFYSELKKIYHSNGPYTVTAIRNAAGKALYPEKKEI